MFSRQMHASGCTENMRNPHPLQYAAAAVLQGFLQRRGCTALSWGGKQVKAETKPCFAAVHAGGEGSSLLGLLEPYVCRTEDMIAWCGAACLKAYRRMQADGSFPQGAARGSEFHCSARHIDS